ncbi:serine hydrolase [candidate division KSB1 bacterium]|nr:serine hydrolase [candidate division KSB1 bacterium]NIR72848.1 serine hydrolase [candidate division KSB1 bacterium]NIS23747.1 serine hydrolase [candidate division KSB1 bacterium]NIT70668.1 serine hydrolase [candidate division KSB1 bacterium]NIU24397.1 serine hydrolase [candidate division KSB1 bacterium]
MFKSIYAVFFSAILFASGCSNDFGPVDVEIPDGQEIAEWKISTPEEQGLDGNIVSNGLVAAERLEFVRSVLIVKNGFLVAERYFGAGKFERNDVRSVTKSFISALVGIALREDYLKNLDQRMLDFFPEYVTSDLDRRKFDITIRHLLTMQAGFDHEINLREETRNMMNWTKTTVELPLVANPGEKFLYNSLETHLLSAILTKATGMSTLAFANEFLFGPAKIKVREWIRDPQGFFSGGSGMFFTSRDLARFGLLYLNNGFLDRKQIVPADWIAESVKNQVEQSGSWGAVKELGYGYQWWVGKINEYNVYMAIGFAGQFIINIPDLDMLIVTTAETPTDLGEADQQGIAITRLIANEILPAVKN